MRKVRSHPKYCWGDVCRYVGLDADHVHIVKTRFFVRINNQFFALFGGSVPSKIAFFGRRCRFEGCGPCVYILKPNTYNTQKKRHHV